MGEMRKCSLKKPLFGRVVDKAHLRAMTTIKGATLCLEGKIDPF